MSKLVKKVERKGALRSVRYEEVNEKSLPKTPNTELTERVTKDITQIDTSLNQQILISQMVRILTMLYDRLGTLIDVENDPEFKGAGKIINMFKGYTFIGDELFSQFGPSGLEKSFLGQQMFTNEYNIIHDREPTEDPYKNYELYANTNFHVIFKVDANDSVKFNAFGEEFMYLDNDKGEWKLCTDGYHIFNGSNREETFEVVGQNIPHFVFEQGTTTVVLINDATSLHSLEESFKYNFKCTNIAVRGDTSNITSLRSAFTKTALKTAVILPTFENVETIESAYQHCSFLEYVDKIQLPSCKIFKSAFENTPALNVVEGIYNAMGDEFDYMFKDSAVRCIGAINTATTRSGGHGIPGTQGASKIDMFLNANNLTNPDQATQDLITSEDGYSWISDTPCSSNRTKNEARKHFVRQMRHLFKNRF